MRPTTCEPATDRPLVVGNGPSTEPGGRGLGPVTIGQTVDPGRYGALDGNRDRVLDPPARPFTRVAAWLPPFLLVVASVAARLPALVNARGVNSDAAVVGLQAMHILHGEWSWYLWGAGYQASLDAALVAAAFAVTGPSALTLMVVPLVGYLILVGLTYDVLRRAVVALSRTCRWCSRRSRSTASRSTPAAVGDQYDQLAVWLASRAGAGRRCIGGQRVRGQVHGLPRPFTLQMMPARRVRTVVCAATAPPGRRRRAPAGLRPAAPDAHRGRSRWPTGHTGLTLDKMAPADVMADQCPPTAGVKVFVGR